MHRILILAAALLLPAGAAMAQGSPGKCAADPRFIGCYPGTGAISRANVLPMSIGDVVRSVSVGQVLAGLLAADVTAALGYIPAPLANPAFIGNVTVSGTAIMAAASVSTSLIAPLGTPASATAACTAGQRLADASYDYVCVAANTWKRAGLASW